MRKELKSRERIPFFSLNATYSIDPEAPLCDLLEDLSCLLGAGVGALMDHDSERLTQAQWAGVYAVQQAHAILERIGSQVHQKFAKGSGA